MQKHNWIIEVCEDLKSYAKKHNLAHLETQLNTALTAAKHEVLLADLDIAHHRVRDCSVIGAGIGLCNHQRERTHETKRRAPVRCQ